MKRADPSHDVRVLERNALDATFGFGVVFSDAALQNLAAADRPTYEEMTRAFHHWDDIDVHFNGTLLRSTGHGFSGLSRRALLAILSRRAEEVGVCVEVGAEVQDVTAYGAADLVVGADGFSSVVRRQFREELEGHRLLANRSLWRSFGTLRTERWHCENVVLLGDAAHTAHFSVGSGTKLAMEDAMALAQALGGVDRHGLPAALEAYEAE